MSYPGMEPADVQTLEPVGTQEPSAGKPAPNPLLANVSQDMHEDALRKDNFVHINPSELKDAVQEAVTDIFALKNTWKPKSQKVRFVIDCPSGQKVLARHLTTMDLLEADLVEEIDFFTKRLFPQDLDAAGNPIEKSEDDDGSTIWKVLRDIEKRKRFLELLNRLLVTAVEKPKVINDNVEIATDSDGNKFLINGSEMDAEDYVRIYGKELPELGENETYASAVDFTDKMHIFGELNKPLGVIQPFRAESAASVASMATSESIGSQT